MATGSLLLSLPPSATSAKYEYLNNGRIVWLQTYPSALLKWPTLVKTTKNDRGEVVEKVVVVTLADDGHVGPSSGDIYRGRSFDGQPQSGPIGAST